MSHVATLSVQVIDCDNRDLVSERSLGAGKLLDVCFNASASRRIVFSQVNYRHCA